MSLFAELKRRNVFRVAIGYAVLGWLLLQVTDVVVPILDLPDWVDKLVLFLLVLGFPLVLFFAWAFELTPEGVKREKEVDRTQSISPQTGRKLDFAIIAVLVLALAWFAWDKFGSDQPALAPMTAQAESNQQERRQADESRSVAVLPFVAMSSGEDDEYFADGLTEEILNSLAQLPELLVTARTSSFSFKGQDTPVTEIAETLGVAHIVEGSVRRSGDRLRVTAQLVRAADGFHVWSENYDSTSEDTIQVQEDIAEKIAEAMDVVMSDEKREAMRRVGLRNVEAFVLMQKANELFESAHQGVPGDRDLEKANGLYEKVLEIVPGYPPAYVAHADLFTHTLANSAYTIGDQTLSDEEIQAAYDQMVNDLTSALEYARNFEEQNRLEIDLGFVSGNWRGITTRVQRYIDSDECDFPTWAQQIAVPFMNARDFAGRVHQLIECNPLQSSYWFYEARARIWSGQAEVAIELMRNGMEKSTNRNLSIGLNWALIASGKFEELDHFIQNSIIDDGRRLVFAIDRLAAMGEAHQVQDLLDELEQVDFNNGFIEQSLLAHTGNREAANRLAARVDEHLFGPQSLIQVIIWCMCGAPWDIEVTPRFAEAIEAANLDWPPESPIHWPLKDW